MIIMHRYITTYSKSDWLKFKYVPFRHLYTVYSQGLSLVPISCSIVQEVKVKAMMADK